MAVQPLRTYPSKSSPGVVHTVGRDDADMLSCTCSGWRFAKDPKPRGCPHTRDFIKTQTPRGWTFVQRGLQTYVYAEGVVPDVIMLNDPMPEPPASTPAGPPPSLDALRAAMAAKAATKGAK